jgi:N-acetylneuraminate synthase
LVGGIRKIEKALGSEKRVHGRERPIREWAFRSVVSIVRIKAGQQITEDMVWTKRPGTGIPSKRMREVIGKTAKVNIPANTLIRWEDLE